MDAKNGVERLKQASCELTNDKGKWFVSTPGTVTVHRSYADLHVMCEKDGYDPGVATVKSYTKGMMAGNILFGGIIGGAVDASTGAAYDYPSMITINMGESVEIAKEIGLGDEAATPTDSQ